MIQQFDIVIVGGGMVGLSLAAALKDAQLQIAVIEGREPELALSDDYANRVSALTRASERYLQRLGVWDSIASRRVAPYTQMAVWEHDSFGAIEFDAADFGEDNLGHIVENQVIQAALWQQVAQQDNVEIFAPAICDSITMGGREAFVVLDDGRHLTASLVVGADGANSWVRRQLNIPLTHWDYGHHALVANIRTELPHQGCARQIFRPSGPLAFLPLPESDLCSIVWSLPPEEAQELLAMSPEAFTQALTVAFDNRLGLCELVGERASHPLTMRYARDFVVDRCVLIGDAAHTIHPLAGQGVNLGFMDAAALAQTIMALQAEGTFSGSKAELRSFERWRKAEAAQMIGAMEGFKHLFAGTNPAKRLVRSLGLRLANDLPGVKPVLIRRAMGLSGQLPDLAR
uniref:FAD-dependent 2-octaprenylphenol hydroxylase n=1 Tax=Thaumasiovibrio occultus TaxID=1891184 RepID=UPI000B35B51B|nr:FAD-dependent 2-octaprenylphenol hydroxylase [Thaumasiovibrio occultus]